MAQYETFIQRKKLSIVSEDTTFKTEKISSSTDINKYVRNFYDTDIELYESFFMVMLNRNNVIEGYVKISQGGITGTVVDVKLIAHYSISCLAQSVILCHNHPSGNIKPSTQDIELTKRIKQTLSLFECSVLDHIIITKDSYYSFADEGQI